MAAALAAAAAPAAPVLAQAPLAVPYLPQTEALCGGAAAAMVMRFWGARGVYADAFAPLVDKAANGIHTSALSAALDKRGWITQSGGGDLQRLSHEVDLGHPVIALIEDRPGRFHYVVVVAARPAGPIVIHDPARAPSRTFDAPAFDRRWQRSDRWMLVLLPGGPNDEVKELQQVTEKGTVPFSGGPPDSRLRKPCDSDVDEAVALAQGGDTAGARRLLERAATQCPRDAAPLRELAGLDALDRQWPAAAEHARQALERDPADAYARRLLATAEYLRQNEAAALAAWNALGEPRVDLVDIKGLKGTRYLVVADAIGMQPRDLLTQDAILTAQKRVREIPAISTAHVSFHPIEGGLAQVDASIVERPRAPISYPALLTMGAGAIANRELAASFANVSGGGDAIDVAWRWWARRPRVAASYAAPGPGGVWRLQVFHETQTFGATRFEETRTRIGGELANWITGRLRVNGGLALDRWHDLGRTAATSGRVQVWPVVDRVSVETGFAGWFGSGERFGAADVRGRFRSKTATLGTVVLAEGGCQAATATAPLSVWPGADSGSARDVLLRAHPLLDDGIIAGSVFGRRIGFASVEAQRWLQPMARGLVRAAPAIFVDAARAARGLPSSNDRLQIDAGAGLRLAVPGSGILRLDVAHGLRDGRTAFSIGWQR